MVWRRKTSWFSMSVARFNGDDVENIVIAAAGVDLPSENIGQTFVIFGQSGGFPAVVDATYLDGTRGFVVTGENQNDFSASAVDGTGDVNGDGLNDLLIGAELSDPNGLENAGRGYVLFGQESGLGASFSLSGGSEQRHSLQQ